MRSLLTFTSTETPTQELMDMATDAIIISVAVSMGVSTCLKNGYMLFKHDLILFQVMLLTLLEESASKGFV
jgi:hypothetical protein